MNKHNSRITHATHWCAALVVLLLALAAGPAQAGTYTWIVDAAGPTPWDAAASWDVGTGYPNAVDDVANLTIDITADNAVSVGTPITIGTLTIGDASGNNKYTINAGSALTFGASSGPAALTRTATGSGADAINTPITLNTNLTVTVDYASGSLTIGGAIGESGGSKSLTKDGAGTLILSSATSSYSGGTVINAGQVTANADNNFGAAGTAITFNGNATWSQAGNVTFNRSLTLTNEAVATLLFNSKNTLLGPVTGTGGLAVQGYYNDLTLSSLNNTFTGPVTIGPTGPGEGNNGYRLTVNSFLDSAVYGTGNITLGWNKSTGGGGQGVKFIWGSGATSALVLNNRQIELVGGTTTGNNYTTIRNDNATYPVTINSDLLVSAYNSPRTLYLAGSSGATVTNTFAGTIADGSVVINVYKGDQLTGNDVSTWVLSGANTYSGNTTVASGALVLASTGQLKFVVTDTSNNFLTNAATAKATLNGTFNIDTSATTGASVGPWTLVGGSVTYGSTFSVAGFTSLGGGLWQLVSGSQYWVFSQSTGKLSLFGSAQMVSFGIPGSAGVINNSAMTIALTVPYTPWATIGLTTLAPTFLLSSGTCDQTSGSPPSPTFTTPGTPVSYTVNDGAVTNSYLVSVALTTPSSAKVMSNVYFPGQGYAYPNDSNGTNLVVLVTNGTPVTALAPTYTVSPFASGSPASGASVNFTTPQTYTITAEDGTKQAYSVTVQTAAGYPALVRATLPIAYWPLTEGVGPTAFDQAGGYNATYGSGMSYGKPGPVGATAVGFNTTSISAPYAAALNPSGPFTVECWMYPSNVSSGNRVLVMNMINGQNLANSSDRSGWAFRQNGAALTFLIGEPNVPNGAYSLTATSPNVLTALTWQHVAATYDSATTNVTIYCNGAPVYSATGPKQLFPNFAAPTMIGDRGYGGWTYNGSIGQVALYNRLLTAQEITSHAKDAPIMNIAEAAGKTVVSWVPSGGGTLQTNSVVTGGGGYQDVTGATSPTTNAPAGGDNLFYRVKF